MYESIRVVRGCKIRFKRCLFLRTNEVTERRTQSEHQKLSSWRTRITVSTGLHGGRATGLTVTEREEIFTRTESVARWSREGRATYEAEREALLFDFFLL